MTDRARLAAAFREEVMRHGLGRCWLADKLGLDGCRDKWGQTPPRELEAAHLLPKQRLRLAGLPLIAQYDARTAVSACNRHHSALDGGRLRLEFSDFPEAVHEAARDYGFFWQDGRGWLPGVQVLDEWGEGKAA